VNGIDWSRLVNGVGNITSSAKAKESRGVFTDVVVRGRTKVVVAERKELTDCPWALANGPGGKPWLADSGNG